MSSGDADFLVSYSEVRKESLAALTEIGYSLHESALKEDNDVPLGNWERAVGEREVEPGIFIRIFEKPPRTEFHFVLIKRGEGVLGSPWVDERRISKDRTVSFRSPEWVRRTVPKVEEALRGLLRVRCPHCGGPMAERKVKDPKSKNFGKVFLGCLMYPECRGAVADWIPRAAPDDGKLVGVNCPDCGAPLVVRYVKKEDSPSRGQSFIGCSAFPGCRRIVSQEEVTALRIMGGGVEPEIF